MHYFNHKENFLKCPLSRIVQNFFKIFLKVKPVSSTSVSCFSCKSFYFLCYVFRVANAHFIRAHGFNVKSLSPKIKHCTFLTLHRILIISCMLCFCECFCSSHPCSNRICTITISYKISSNTILFKLPDEVCMFRRNRQEIIKKLTTSAVTACCSLVLVENFF